MGAEKKTYRRAGCFVAVFLVVALLSTGGYFLYDAVRNEEYDHLCQIHLKVMGMVLRMFAYDNGGSFPQLSPHAGRLVIRNQSSDYAQPLYPESLNDLELLYCPRMPEFFRFPEEKPADPQAAFDKCDYMYLGYALTSEAEVEAFAGAYKDRVAKGLPFNEDLAAPQGTGTNGGDKIYRLREGVERFYITDTSDPAANDKAQAKIPILIERLGHHHKPEGANVVFLNGYVKFIQYPGPWPMTEKTIGILQSLETTKGE